MNNSTLEEVIAIEKMLSNWQQLLAVEAPFEGRILWLENNISVMTNQIITLGNSAFQILEQGNSSSEISFFKANYITYEWAEHAKRFLLLLRDTLFEQQKSHLVFNDKGCNEAQLQTLWENTIQTLGQALTTIEKQSDPSYSFKERVKKLKQWNHQENPWLIYKEQFLKIESQSLSLTVHYLSLLDIQKIMLSASKLIKKTTSDCLVELSTNSLRIDKVLRMLSKASIEEADKPAYILTELHKITDSIAEIEHIDGFNSELEALFLNHKQALSPVVRIKNGILERRDFTPQKDVLLWFESQIYPLLYEIWEITERGASGLKMVLVNLTNRMDILHKDNPSSILKESTSLQKPVHAFQKDLKKTNDSIDSIVELLRSRVSSEFKISYLFDTKHHFLPVSLQTTLNQKFWSSNNSWLLQGQQWLATFNAKINAFRNRITQDQALSTSEKIALCIQSRKADPANNHYTSIFLTKGYVGESFIVGRTEELQRFEQVVSNWQQGFRGTVFLYGNRFAGKTIFAEIAARKFFYNNFYSLIPHSFINVKGRKLQTTVDLHEALDFVCKHAQNDKPLILIDDLELWWSDKIPFYQNIQHLTECIDLYSNRIFFVVTTNSKIKTQLYNFSHFDRIFQAQINLNTLTKESMLQAISIRHGATHKTLLNRHSKQELAPNEFSKMIKRIHKTVGGNIGEGLLRWANSTYFLDDNAVEHRYESYKSLPVFLNEDTSLIIETLLMYKRTNEYELRQMLGEAFSSRYATVVRRMINTGILKRQLDGYIEIEATIVNDLKQMIE